MIELKGKPRELCMEESCEGRTGKVGWCQVVKSVNVCLRKCGSYAIGNREHQKDFEPGSGDYPSVLRMRLA